MTEIILRAFAIKSIITPYVSQCETLFAQQMTENILSLRHCTKSFPCINEIWSIKKRSLFFFIFHTVSGTHTRSRLNPNHTLQDPFFPFPKTQTQDLWLPVEGFRPSHHNLFSCRGDSFTTLDQYGSTTAARQCKSCKIECYWTLGGGYSYGRNTLGFNNT